VVQASPSIRALYKVLGFIVGKQIRNRICYDQHLEPDSAKRKVMADATIAAITKLRKQLSGTRDFNQLRAILEDELSPAQLAWMLEAYFLLNQSSTTSAEIVSDASVETNKEFARELIKILDEAKLTEDEVRDLLESKFSANLVLTAHPTAGIQPDYMNHINNMIATLERVPDRSNVKGFFESNSALAEEIKEALDLSISHMVRAKPYNERVLSPTDESRSFLTSVAKAAEIIPAKLAALEAELKHKFKGDFVLNDDFFKIHSWVARDIDGNPTVSEELHLQSLMQERESFLASYRTDVRKLRQSLSDDFSSSPEIPTKTFFSSSEFEQEYRTLIEQYPDTASPHQAYRVLLDYLVLKPLNKAIEELRYEGKLAEFDVGTQLLRPLELIRANKEGINTQEIDFLIKKAKIFGNFGSKGHTRQGNEILAALMSIFTGFAADDNATKTEFVLKDNTARDYVSEAREQLKKQSGKQTKRIKQTLDLLALARYGGIERQIISMNESFADMLNVLVLAKCLGAFIPARSNSLPQSRLEIVPLTERISDLRNSYQCTIDALMNPAWRQYLLAQGGRFIKMRGPSDSGKQNGFIAAQWEMFKSKAQDTLVIEIFNAYLLANVFDDANELSIWRKLAEDNKVAELALSSFATLFADFDGSEKILWLKSGITRINLVNFDGWGEPIERGGGLEFKDTVRYTQPLASSPIYERTLQGGGAQQFGSAPRTRTAIKEYIQGLLELSARSINSRKTNLKKHLGSLIFSPEFIRTMDSWSYALRKSLRNEVFGLDTELDDVCISEENLRTYFRHVIKSPLIYLDHFNIASRPTSRSGTKVKELLDAKDVNASLDRLSEMLPVTEILSVLADIRAIPYAAMFSLVGGNHVSFYGFAAIEESTISELKDYYHRNDSSQEHFLVKHMIDSLEKGVFTMDMNCYAMAHSIIERATNTAYKADDDLLLKHLLEAEQAVRDFIAKVKNYPKTKQVALEDLLIHDTETRDLLIARRNDAAVPRTGIAIAMNKIIAAAYKAGLNPLDPRNISAPQLDLLRKAFASGASTFGNGCID
jgi:phosphoenolpyruvate carboxylase